MDSYDSSHSSLGQSGCSHMAAGASPCSSPIRPLSLLEKTLKYEGTFSQATIGVLVRPHVFTDLVSELSSTSGMSAVVLGCVGLTVFDAHVSLIVSR